MEDECCNCGNEYAELTMPGTNDPICLECARNHGIDELADYAGMCPGSAGELAARTDSCR